MPLRIYNTLTRSIEEFVPRDTAGKTVGMYCCGPTVYDFGHIGNFRTFLFADLVRRYLEYKGYKPLHVMNITDVEDKIIHRVREAGVSLRDFTAKYEQAFLEDMDRLSCRRPHKMPKATDFVPSIVVLIQRLVDRDMAYVAPDGSVYFSISKYRSAGWVYGQLTSLNFDEMRSDNRIKHDDYAKEAIADFALWKARVPEDGQVFWPSPWGEGRPGWHIECSAMSMDLLGASFDLHLGGEDLVFPHHEDEIAQSEGAGLQTSGERFVKYWLHGAHLLVEGKKMAKSSGNFFTLRDLAQQGFSGREIRYVLLSAHYRQTFNFSIEGLRGARSALDRLDECLGKLAEKAAGAESPADGVFVSQVEAALDEDLNVAAAWGAVFEWVREQNRRLAQNSLSSEQAAAGLAAWKSLDTFFGIGRETEAGPPPEMLELLQARQEARRAKDFKRADALRDEIKSAGWTLEDTTQGPKLKKA